jgi:hypothetical protein
MEEHANAIDRKIKEALTDSSKPFNEVFIWFDEYMQKCNALYREAEKGNVPPANPANVDWLFNQLEKLTNFGNHYKSPGCVQRVVKDLPDPL